MGQRKYQRVILTTGILILLAVLLCAETEILEKELQKLERARMGALVSQYPDQEREIVAVFQGNGAADDGADAEAIQKAGDALAEKYGISGVSKDGYHFIHLYEMMMLVTVFAGIGAVLLLWRQSAREEQQVKEQEERKLEELKELTVRYEKMKERLEKEESDTKTLISDISHQLKTPIASLKMSYELLESTALSEEEQREFRQNEYEELKKLERLLEALMNLSKLETKMIQIRPISAGIRETLRSAVNSVYMKALDKQIDISLEEFPDRKVLHDPKWTAEVFVNVLDNGIKYSEEKKRIFIRVNELVSCLLIEIRDEGIGIDPKERNQIFKRFYRGKHDNVQSVEGSGIGLYLARRIIEEQGGTICVKGAVSGGSIFQITLPYAENAW